MNIFKLLGIVVICLVVYLLLRSFNERFAVFLSLGAGIVMLFYVCTQLSSVFDFVNHLAKEAGIKNEYFSVIIKGLSICYLGEFAVSACKDCGQNGWGEKLDLACRCTLLVLAIPLFEDFLKVIIELVET